MKKILITMFVFILFIPYVSAQEPPLQIIIRSEEELAEMRKIAETDEEELLDYLKQMNYRVNGMTNREDVVAFLKLLDSLPIPYIPGMQFGGITYYPELNTGSQTQTLNISFKNEAGERHSLRLFAGGDKGKSVFEDGEQLVEIYRSENNGKQIILYSPDTWNSFPTEHGIYFFPIQIDGYFISAGYNFEDYKVILGITPEEIYKNIIITSFADEPWTINATEQTEETVSDNNSNEVITDNTLDKKPDEAVSGNKIDDTSNQAVSDTANNNTSEAVSDNAIDENLEDVVILPVEDDSQQEIEPDDFNPTTNTIVDEVDESTEKPDESPEISPENDESLDEVAADVPIEESNNTVRNIVIVFVVAALAVAGVIVFFRIRKKELKRQ